MVKLFILIEEPMPAYKKIGENKYQYKCECGRLCTLESDEKPLKRLEKCWMCQSEVDLSKIKEVTNDNKKSNDNNSR